MKQDLERLTPLLIVGLMIFAAIGAFVLIPNVHAQTDWRAAFANPDAVLRAVDDHPEKALTVIVDLVTTNAPAKAPAVFQALENKLLKTTTALYRNLPDDIRAHREKLVAQYGENSAEVQAFDAKVRAVLDDVEAVIP